MVNVDIKYKKYTLGNYRININKLILFMCKMSIIIDLFTGAILISKPDSHAIIGVLYKFIFLLFLYSYILKLNKIVLFSILILFVITVLASLNDSIYSLPVNLISTSKLLVFVLLFYYLKYLIKVGFLNTKILFDIARFTFIVIVVNQLLGLFGFGKPTYKLDNINIGTSGFFFETNSYSYILIIVIVIFYYYINAKITFTKKILFLIFCLFLGVSIATKVAIGGVIISSLIILGGKSKKQLFLFLLIGFALVYIQRDRLYNSTQALFYIDKFDQDPNRAFYSDRDVSKEKGLTTYVEKYSFFEKVVGIGQFRMINDKIYGGTTEMDYIDILKTYGLLGLIVVYFPYLMIIIQQYRMYRKTNFEDFKITFIMNLFLFILSCLAGHFLISGSVSIYLAILNVYPFLSYTEHLKTHENKFDKIKIESKLI